MGQQETATGESMRTLRKLAGMSLEEAAAAADTSVAYLSKVETGKFAPSKSYVAKVTAAIATQLAGRAA